MAKPLNTMFAFGPRQISEAVQEYAGDHLLIGIDYSTDEVVDITTLDEGTTADDVSALMSMNSVFTKADRFVLIHRSSDFNFEGLTERGNPFLLDELVLVGNRMRSVYCDNLECCPPEGQEFTR